MSRRHQPAFRLEALRRSARLAFFALAIILLRVGMVVACAPSDIAEIAHVAEHALFSDATHADDGDSQNPCGDCLHSGCHLAATIPVSGEQPVISLAVALTDLPPLARANAPPKLMLRPPIV
ncbi:MAG: hypothetical protein AB7E72_08000 [Lysobacterales bacterium]|nr:hypothetical protein [Nitrosomonas nitrosa]